jgi:transmembrane sensor
MRRVILQRGEAHFEVTKNPQRPFLVTAAGIDIRAVGTAFGVQLGTTAVEVLVTEGRVSVEKSAGSSRNGRKGTGDREPQTGNSEPGIESPGPEAGADGGRARGDGTGTHSLAPSLPYLAPITLDAGNRVVVDIINETALPLTSALTRVELARRLSWRAPRLEFSDTPLAEAVALMNRYSTIRIEIADTSLARMRVNGLFRADNTDTFVRLLEASFDATAERAEDVVVLKRVKAPGR